MKRRMRQGMAMMMAVFTLLSVMPVQNLYAAEVDGQIQEQEESVDSTAAEEEVESTETEELVESTEAEETVGSTEIQEETESTECKDLAADTESETAENAVEETNAQEAADAYLLNYLVIESAYVETPGMQKVVAGVGGEDITITEAVLYYANKDTKEEYQASANRISENAMLFCISFENAERSGIYELHNITYTADGKTYDLDLTGLDKDTVFGVNKAIETEADAYIVDEEADTVETEVVTFDEEGNQTSEKSIAEAMEDAISGNSIISRTYAAGTGGAKNDFVVVLDPGHGGSDPGACRTINGVNYYERDIVLKIAQYCKAELENSGVKVYLTRTDNTSPLMDRRERTDYAVSVGADVIVSLHINSTSGATTTASGSMVYVPNTDTVSGTVSNELAEVILQKLAELGLKNRGSIVDEGLGMILYPKEEGIPGILVEHAFVNNPSDVANYLSTEEQLKKLGTADAKGILEYFAPMLEGFYNGINYAAVYNYDYYVTKYPDIKNAFGNNRRAALAHFVNYGMKEGRQGSENFNVHSYRYRYADLRKVFGNSLKKYYLHYITNGRYEGRTAVGTASMQNPVTRYGGIDYSAVYDYSYYIAKHPNVIALCGGDDDTAVLKYFVEHGISEGHQANASFNVNSYRYRYPDLRRAFGTNLKKYYIHYITNGRFEGRAGTGTTSMQNPTTKYNGVDYSAIYDYTYYSTKYPDVKQSCNGDDTALLKYFVEVGMKSGHRGNAVFDVNSYRYRYSDLRSAYGTDLKKYYMHYMNYGRFEGRAGTGTTTMQNPTTKYNGVDYSAVYDYHYYMTKNPDIKNALGDDDTVVLAHFVNYGMSEGRLAKENFNVYVYKSNYVDLQSAYGNSLKPYYMHYNNYGKNEGRNAITYMYTAIMGRSNTTVTQMVNYYNANASYPGYYMNDAEAKTIWDFCRIYMEECNAEGVRAEVAFAQAMKETGYLRFTGRVPVEAYNFAGLGAIDSDETAWATFPTVRMGIRAQVQHLKAYATTTPLNNPCVDPRFNLVRRGSAQYVEWLGQKENPNGYGWATAVMYGYSVKNDYMAKLARYQK